MSFCHDCEDDPLIYIEALEVWKYGHHVIVPENQWCEAHYEERMRDLVELSIRMIKEKVQLEDR